MTLTSRRCLVSILTAVAILTGATGCWPFDGGAQPPPTSGGGAQASPGPAASTPPVPTASPSSSGLSGQWVGTWANQTPDHSTGTLSLTWTQTGSALAGTITIDGTPCLSGGSITGTIIGNSIQFGVVSGQVVVDYTGQVSGATISGTYETDCGNARGSWTANKQ